MFFLALNLNNRELEVLFTQGSDFHVILILDLILNLERLVIGRCCRHLDFLYTQLVVDDDGSIGTKLDRAVELLGFLLLGGLVALGWLAREAFIHFLEIRDLGIELLKVEATIHRPYRLVGNIVTRRYALHNSTTVPTVCRVIGSVGCNPAQDRNLVERRLVGYIKGLVIGPWRTQVLD